MPGTQPNQRDLRLLGRAIDEIRAQGGLSVRDLSIATGIEESTIQAVEAGQVDADFDMLLRLAEALGLRPSAFVIRAEHLAGRAPREERKGE